MGVAISKFSAYIFDTPAIMDVPFEAAKTFKRDKWMEEMQDQIRDTRLVDLHIPGSHHSGSYSCNLSQAMCQNCDITQQLARGVRFLDIRVGYHFRFHSGEGRIGHGYNSWGTYFEDIIEDIYNFVKDHPKEFLILEIRKSGVLEDSHKTYMRERIIHFLKDWMVTSNDGLELKTAKMKDLWEKGRRVWVFFAEEEDVLNLYTTKNNKQVLDLDGAMKQGIYPHSGHLHYSYVKTEKKTELLNYLNNEMKEIQSGKYNDNLVLTNLFLTPGVIKSIYPGVRKLAENLQNDDSDFKWFEEQNSKGNRLNIINMNFIFGTSENNCSTRLRLIDAIISSNRKVLAG